MTSTLPEPTGSSNTKPEHHHAPAASGRFMLTLCRLAAPVALRPPQSPQLKPYTFFMSRVRQAGGSETLYLHMGYFATLSDAEKWVHIVQSRYPNAFVTIAPAASTPPPTSNVPAEQPADARARVARSSDTTPIGDQSLTDTQVLGILEARRARVQHDVDERKCEQIALVRPEDTVTREAVREAVIQGAPVSFAVQLQWSARPIDLSRVPALPIFKAHTLYATESRRQGRSSYFLRLGFFGDPISAKQVAVQVRSNFPSTAVVPVAEQEVMHARQAAIASSSIPCFVQQRVDRPPDSNGTPESQSKPLSSLRRSVSRAAETLKETLQRLAEREMLIDPESLSESGVRHLRVDDVQEQRPGRS